MGSGEYYITFLILVTPLCITFEKQISFYFFQNFFVVQYFSLLNYGLFFSKYKLYLTATASYMIGSKTILQ